MYDLKLFKEKLQECKDTGEARALYSAIAEQVVRLKSARDDISRALEEKEQHLAAAKTLRDEVKYRLEMKDSEISEADRAIDNYKSAMIERIRELTG